MKRLYDFFTRVLFGKSSTQSHPHAYQEVKGNPYTNKDEEGNPLPPWINFPDTSPFDFFYREAGGIWLNHIWNSFWDTMSKEQQQSI
ncbi:unnamed protein product [Commensalibacter communis]|uniref:hypothetical protein n=1 Tax=Commensalibacter communis TaxID=2972786 RepID=UPI0022FF7131|nr:hypothetical protein [Commensalibacter communis]CAI3926554.1 unnamed protein product [Commensalibacter communis]CAI3932594.1 unnamed protein product [Commensalibacter communis]